MRVVRFKTAEHASLDLLGWIQNKMKKRLEEGKNMRVIKQGELFHLYLVDDKDVWMTTDEMKRLYNILGANLGVENAVIKDGKVFVFTDDEEGVDECSRCMLFHECKEGSLCTDCFKENLIGKRFKLL